MEIEVAVGVVNLIFDIDKMDGVFMDFLDERLDVVGWGVVVVVRLLSALIFFYYFNVQVVWGLIF